MQVKLSCGNWGGGVGSIPTNVQLLDPPIDRKIGYISTCIPHFKGTKCHASLYHCNADKSWSATGFVNSRRKFVPYFLAHVKTEAPKSQNYLMKLHTDTDLCNEKNIHVKSQMTTKRKDALRGVRNRTGVKLDLDLDLPSKIKNKTNIKLDNAIDKSMLMINVKSFL